MFVIGNAPSSPSGADFGWCLLAVVVMGLQVLIDGFMAGRIRKKVFTPTFFKVHFPSLKNFPEQGYPDMGSGMYASKLSHDDWLRFNNAQRAHYNYLEGIASIIVFELVAGLFFPRYAALLGFTYILGRAVYGIGYRSSGSKGRYFGVIIADLSLLALLAMSFYGAFNFTGGFYRLLGI